MGINSLRIQTLGGFGYPDPAPFSFALSGAAAWKSAVKSAITRYGKAPSSGSDARPIAPEFYQVYNGAWNQKSRWAGSSSAMNALLQGVGAPFNGAAGISFTSTKKDDPGYFTLSANLGANESVAFRGSLFEVDGDGDDVKGHIWYKRIGEAGQGVIFQVRDGSPEFGRMSKDWTRDDEDALRLLWGLSSPTSDEQKEVDRLEKLIYSSFESLSLENTTGRDTFTGDPFLITLIPDPYGGIHVVLGSGDAVRIEPLDNATSNTVWAEGAAIEVGQTGGAWMLQLLNVRFYEGSLRYGPYLFSNVGDPVFTSSAFSQAGADGEPIGNVNFGKKDFDGPTDPPDDDDDSEVTLTPFYLQADFTSTDSRYGAWLYALSVETEAGERTGLTETGSFDSDDLTDVPSSVKVDSKPILNSRLSCNENGSRSLTLTMRDVKGATSQTVNGGIDGMVGHMANVTRGGNALFTQAVVARGRLIDPARMAIETGGGPRRFGIDVSKADTTIELEVQDGRFLLREILCNPAIISDGRHLGGAIRQRLRRAGYSYGEMARVPIDFGPLLPKAGPGEDWASITDTSDDLDSSIDALLDRFGLGLRFYQDQNGVWVLESRPTTVLTDFTSKGSKNDPKLKRVGSGGTRAIIKGDGFTWERDNEDFYNIFRVVGGKDGKEIVREFVDSYSMKLANTGVHPSWVGRPKAYPTLRDPGLGTVAQVLYALRSLRERHGKPGRIANFESYFDREYFPYDRVRLDGILCEFLSWDADPAEDAMYSRVREVI